MKRLWTVLFCSCMALSNADIHTTAHLEEAEKHLLSVDKTGLILFDVDNVLLIPAEPAFQIVNWQRHKTMLGQYLHQLTPQEQDAWFNSMVLFYDSQLLDSHAPQLVQSLQARSIPCLAFTGVWNGYLSSVGDLEQFRVRRLRQHGFDFSSALDGLRIASLDTAPANLGRRPSLYQGVLFANGIHVDKGSVLHAFLETTGLRPTQVAMIDDRRGNLESVESTLARWDIPFIGIHYTAAEEFDTEELDAAEFRQRLEKSLDESAALLK